MMRAPQGEEREKGIEKENFFEEIMVENLQI